MIVELRDALFVGWEAVLYECGCLKNTYRLMLIVRRESSETVTDQPLLLSALTLRGPSGGHCVELHCKAYLKRKQWALRTHCLHARLFCELKLKAPRSGPRRAEAEVGVLHDS